ncbi:VWA domain-containing protein [Jatrophihabitans sp. YIM 134969]
MNFQSPVWLWLLVPIAAILGVYVWQQLRRKRYVARFSNVDLLATVVPRRPGWRRHTTFAALMVALIVLTVGVAQPTGKVRVPRERATVIIALDVSQSMRANDVLPDRITAAKQAAKDFVDLLPPRINVGLVKFAGSASVVVPPTIDRDSLKVAVDNLELADSTGIGEAVFTSLDAVATFSKATTAKDDQPAPARIVLLSDGYNNRGRKVSSAAAAAEKAKVPVSTIAFGTDDGTLDLDGQVVSVPADKTTLSRLADDTGGTFHTATSAEELRQVYQDIGSQIGYTTAEREISWRFLLAGLLVAIVGAGLSLLWSGRLT